MLNNAIVLNNKKDAFQKVAGLLSTLFPDPSPYELPHKIRKTTTKAVEVEVAENELGLPLKELMSLLRFNVALQKTAQPAVGKDSSRIFNPMKYFTLVSIYQDGKQMIRWGCKRKSLDKAILNNTERLSKNMLVTAHQSGTTRPLCFKLEIIHRETAITITEENIDDQYVNTGLKIVAKGNAVYLLPSDSSMNNYNTLRDKLHNLIKLSDFLSKQLDLADIIEQSGKDLKCYLVHSFWAIEVNNSIYHAATADGAPYFCRQWQPYHPDKP